MYSNTSLTRLTFVAIFGLYGLTVCAAPPPSPDLDDVDDKGGVQAPPAPITDPAQLATIARTLGGMSPSELLDLIGKPNVNPTIQALAQAELDRRPRDLV